jgi:hypothetical protein
MTRRAILALVLVVAVGVALVWAVPAFIRYANQPYIHVVVTNDSSSTVTFACSPDEAPATPPGHDARLTFGVGRDQLCAVAEVKDASLKYFGCVSVDTDQGAPVARQVLSKVLTPVGERDCG